jgi:hypothetical protein
MENKKLTISTDIKLTFLEKISIIFGKMILVETIVDGVPEDLQLHIKSNVYIDTKSNIDKYQIEK